MKTLDDYAFENVCLVKIDVEGHELEVLKGGVQTLQRERPVILVEIEQRHHNLPISEVFAYLMAQDFAGFFLGSGKLVPLSEFSFETHQKPYLKDVNNRAYVNNFLFLPRESVSPALLRNCVR